VDERQKRSTTAIEVFGHASADARDADCQQEAIARLGHERGGIAKNRNSKSVVTKQAWVSGEKTGYPRHLIGPRIAGPVERFATKTAGANDKNPSHRSHLGVLREGGAARVHSVPLGGFSSKDVCAARPTGAVYTPQAAFLPGACFANEYWLSGQPPERASGRDERPSGNRSCGNARV
jgi:hypothetical protein